jgi:putative endonuclease
LRHNDVSTVPLVVRIEQHHERSTREPAKGRHADPRRTLGRLGEELAAAHLLGTGYAVLERNARTRHGEIDLIVFDGSTLVFVEVKTLRVSAAATPPRPDQHPLLRLRHRQRASLRRLAVAWLSDASKVRPSARTIRFDAIGVSVDTRGSLRALDHVEGAW